MQITFNDPFSLLAVAALLIGAGVLFVFLAAKGIIKVGKTYEKEPEAAETVKEVLGEFFQEPIYRPGEAIPREQILQTGIWNSEEAENVEGNDYIQARYKGMPFQYCDARLFYLDRVPLPEDEGVDHNSYREVSHQVFKGQWVIVQAAQRPKAVVNVVARSSGYRFKNTVKTEHKDLDERFEITGDPEAVHEILDPLRIQQILAAEAAAGGCSLFLRFLPDGRVGICLSNKDNLLEAGGSTDRETLRQKLRGEMAWVLRVVDALGLE